LLGPEHIFLVSEIVSIYKWLNSVYAFLSYAKFLME
jgi:hypothetical protein